MIGDNVVINIVEVQGDNVRIAIDAPRDIKIYRGEIYRAIQEENKKAALNTSEIDFSQILPRPEKTE
jgi:carbon storage regulator